MPYPSPPPEPPGRLRLAIVGALLFGLGFPAACTAAVFVALRFARTATQGEVVGLAGFTLAGLALPVGAVVRAIVSAAGAPERVGRRRLIAAVVLGGLVLAFWAAMFLA